MAVPVVRSNMMIMETTMKKMIIIFQAVMIRIVTMIIMTTMKAHVDVRIRREDLKAKTTRSMMIMRDRIMIGMKMNTRKIMVARQVVPCVAVLEE
jgi:hypothetical protein